MGPEEVSQDHHPVDPDRHHFYCHRYPSELGGGSLRFAPPWLQRFRLPLRRYTAHDEVMIHRDPSDEWVKL